MTAGHEARRIAGCCRHCEVDHDEFLSHGTLNDGHLVAAWGAGHCPGCAEARRAQEMLRDLADMAFDSIGEADRWPDPVVGLRIASGTATGMRSAQLVHHLLRVEP